MNVYRVGDPLPRCTLQTVLYGEDAAFMLHYDNLLDTPVKLLRRTLLCTDGHDFGLDEPTLAAYCRTARAAVARHAGISNSHDEHVWRVYAVIWIRAHAKGRAG